MNTKREEFLAGQRPEDVHIYLHEGVVQNPEALEEYGERVEDGVVLVLEGDEARGLFQRTVGVDPMALAKEAMGTDGDIGRNCATGTCPTCSESEPKFVFAFAESQNEEVGGLYAEGPVIHAYASCECGERYSAKWVVE